MSAKTDGPTGNAVKMTRYHKPVISEIPAPYIRG
jgi:hypothetical protein